MKKNFASPVLKFQEQPYTRLLIQDVKRPNRVPYKVKFDEVSLLLVQNKVIGNLSPITQQYLAQSLGNHDPGNHLSDDSLIVQTVNDRRLQEPSDIKRFFEKHSNNLKTGMIKFKDSQVNNEVNDDVSSKSD